MQITLTPDMYNEFLMCIQILKDVCNDLDIRDGVIRQRHNDKSAMFEGKLGLILGEINLPILNLKQKLDMLRIFYNREVSLTLTESDFSISDRESRLTFKYPTLDYLDNKFMTEKELASILLVNPKEKILDVAITKRLRERIKIVCASFNVNAISILFSGETASILAKNTSGDQQAVFIQDIPLETELSCKTVLSVTPFILEVENDINLSIFRQASDRNLAVNKFSTIVGGSIDFTVFSRCDLSGGGKDKK